MERDIVRLALSASEAGALFEAGNLWLHRKLELGMPIDWKALDALVKIAKGMGLEPKIVDGTVRLLPPTIA